MRFGEVDEAGQQIKKRHMEGLADAAYSELCDCHYNHNNK